MSESPIGWTTAMIEELIGPEGVFADGDWIESKDQDPGGCIRLIQLQDIQDGMFADKSNRFINEKTFQDLNCLAIKPGDVLIARMPDPLGRACIFPDLGQRCITAVDVCVIRPEAEGVSNLWLMRWINSPEIRRRISELQKGTTRKRISRSNLATIRFPIPPAREQSRIADEIDKQFTRLDAATAALKRVQANLKRYRASVLKAACEGRLLPNDRGHANYPKGPVISLLAQPLANGRSPISAKEGIKILRLTAIKDGNIDTSEWRRGPASESWTEHISIKPGDILVSRGNGSKALVGLAGLVGDISGESEPILFPDTMIRIRLNPEACDARFFVLIWNSRFMRDQIESTARTTAGIHKIAQSDIERFEIPLPSLPDQFAIVAAAETALLIVKHTSQALEKLATRSASMRASILSSAFTGQLVPQDPTDEPASALLERIRAERDSKVVNRPNRGRKEPIYA